MSIQHLKNNLKKLSKRQKEQNPEKKVSVVYINDDGSIDFPENCNDGVLAVPRPMSIKEWEAAYES